jgi:hypothetical protein
VIGFASAESIRPCTRERDRETEREKRRRRKRRDEGTRQNGKSEHDDDHTLTRAFDLLTPGRRAGPPGGDNPVRVMFFGGGTGAAARG